jgi:anti-anti-sigma factor
MRFLAAFNSALSNNGAKDITVDLQNVSFMDSSIIRALITLHRNGMKSQKAVTLVHCSESILEVFKIGGFDGILSIR